MEKEAAPAPVEPPSGSDVARPINMQRASAAPEPLPVFVAAHTPNNARPPSPLPSLCTTPRGTCDCEDYLEEINQCMKVLLAMCIGLVDDQKRSIIDTTQEPWISMKNQNKIKPLNPDLCNDVVRCWETYQDRSTPQIMEDTKVDGMVQYESCNGIL